MPGSAFQRETWELSQVIHLPDSVLAITMEQGEGEQAGERETSLDENHHRRKLNATGLLARRISGSWGPTWAPPSFAVKGLGSSWRVSHVVLSLHFLIYPDTVSHRRDVRSDVLIDIKVLPSD